MTSTNPNMFGYSRLLAESYERCLTPAPSPVSDTDFDHCECCCYCHGHDDGIQSTADGLNIATEEGSPLPSEGDAMRPPKIMLDKIIDRIGQDLARVQVVNNDRIEQLEKRISEVEKLAEIEDELERKWQALVNEQTEELLELKQKIAMNERREHMMELLSVDGNSMSEIDLVKADFTLLLISVDFDREVEDLYGSGTRIFRSFSDFRGADRL